jgi:hypothetical protein
MRRIGFTNHLVGDVGVQKVLSNLQESLDVGDRQDDGVGALLKPARARFACCMNNLAG